MIDEKKITTLKDASILLLSKDVAVETSQLLPVFNWRKVLTKESSMMQKLVKASQINTVPFQALFSNSSASELYKTYVKGLKLDSERKNKLLEYLVAQDEARLSNQNILKTGLGLAYGLDIEESESIPTPSNELIKELIIGGHKVIKTPKIFMSEIHMIAQFFIDTLDKETFKYEGLILSFKSLIQSNKVSEDDIIGVLINSILASFYSVLELLETTRFTLYKNSQLVELLNKNRSLIIPFFWELSRLEPPKINIRRRAISDIELSSFWVKKGQNINIKLNAILKNENSNLMGISSKTPKSIAFGKGKYMCPGKQLTLDIFETYTTFLLDSIKA